MKFWMYAFIAFAFVLCNTTASAQDAQDEVLGIWLTGNKKGKVEIYKKDGKYFGKLIWMKEPVDENGKPKLDKENPDEKLRSREILGLEILRGFEFAKKRLWDDGKIYDPESGNDYSCKMTLTDSNTLEVRGYVGFSWIGRTDVWERVK